MKISTIVLLILFYIGVLQMHPQSRGSFIDKRDGNSYDWIKLGEQIWMAENLSYLPKVDPPKSGVFTSEDKVEYCYVYNYYGYSISEAKETENYKVYGVLYNWEMANHVCPEGWRLPSDKDFMQLEEELGLKSNELNEIYYRMSNRIGHSLKSKELWNDNGTGVDKYGFNALPGGFRHNGDIRKKNPQGGFGFLGTQAFFWTSTDYSPKKAYRRQFNSNNDGIGRYAHEKDQGYSVRCIKKN